MFQTLLVQSRRVRALVEDHRIAAVTLTGSEGAGASVGAAAGASIKKVVMELGGSDPFIVMPSADLENATTVGVAARNINNGQSCIAAKRFIVHEQVLPFGGVKRSGHGRELGVFGIREFVNAKTVHFGGSQPSTPEDTE